MDLKEYSVQTLKGLDVVYITQTDTMVKHMQKKRRESRVWAGDTNHECDSYLSVPPPYGTQQTLTRTKIFKKQSITSKGHHGDYLSPQKPITPQKSHACLPGQVP